MRVILVGGPAAGKSSVGQLLAKQLNCSFMDTDYLIERKAAMPISQIFTEQGEAYFRELETAVLCEALQVESVVIATGGGVVKQPGNRALLKLEPFVVYLDVSVALQMERTQGDTTRPLLQGDNKKIILEQLQQERDVWYREVSKTVLNVNATSAQLVQTIQQWLIRNDNLNPYRK